MYAAGLFCQRGLYVRACLCIRSLSTLSCSAECVVPVGRVCVCVCVCVFSGHTSVPWVVMEEVLQLAPRGEAWLTMFILKQCPKTVFVWWIWILFHIFALKLNSLWHPTWVFLQNKALVISAVYYLRNNNTDVLYICLRIITLTLEFTGKNIVFMACRRGREDYGWAVFNLCLFLGHDSLFPLANVQSLPAFLETNVKC